MSAVSLADAKARLSELVNRVEAGETIEITRKGKVVARLGPAVTPKPPVDVERLRAHLARIPFQDEPAVDTVRAMRDDDRY
ncbi:type II toxin-antitoxin system prevent-host-death family antitoxin [Arsenicitalea aurantiaca]|uniref:Antitoxin n=1 Tax=Arsenicitalea aurantiaca TaxID=1783274 RepID=A0A433XFI6_9HYPH|nr:type II toxin-antitoxin system prevent-host-death family antitoxin [Arsenicitalea aurantiaca]RUT32853.1 type II toxin-antitoxin system prevent-host-death family antitoxin [Arsenicitalea aurantiaca]